MQLRVNLHEDVLCDYALDRRVANSISGAGSPGVRRAAVITTPVRKSIRGVSFAPGGAWPFLGVAASDIGERLVDLSVLWHRRAEALRERLLEVTIQTPARGAR